MAHATRHAEPTHDHDHHDAPTLDETCMNRRWRCLCRWRAGGRARCSPARSSTPYFIGENSRRLLARRDRRDRRHGRAMRKCRSGSSSAPFVRDRSSGFAIAYLLSTCCSPSCRAQMAARKGPALHLPLQQMVLRRALRFPLRAARAALGRLFWKVGDGRSSTGSGPTASPPRVLDVTRGAVRCRPAMSITTPSRC